MRTILLTAAAIAAASAAPALARPANPEERAAIEDLAYRYIFALDWRDAQAYAATFAPDGVLNYGGGKAVGRDAIADMVQGIRDREMGELAEGETGQNTGHGQHFVTAMVIDVSDDGQSAVAQAYWLHVSGVQPQLDSFGHYYDELENVDGQWLYTSRRTYNEQAKGRGTFPFIDPVTNPDRYGADLPQ